jgi:hypothetical protein
MATESGVTLSPAEYEKLKISLKQINIKAQRLQTSTGLEMALRSLQLRFQSFGELVRPLRQASTVDRTPLDRDWHNFRRFEMLSVKSYLVRDDLLPQQSEPVAQNELRAMTTILTKLQTDISGGNWGNVEQQCNEFQDGIENGILECRRVTETELRIIFTITANL